MTTKPRIAIAAAATAGLSLLTALPALSHGYIQNPPSRSYLCSTQAVTDCGPIQWEPQSVEGPKGFPQAGPADGRICAGGDSRWAPLDDPRGGTGWPATTVTAGQSFTFTWTLTAVHATTSFRYFITRDGWDPTQPLTRSALDPQPFLQVNYGGGHPANPVVHNGVIPAGKSGHHLILGVWDIADTANAFYSCADVNIVPAA